MKTCGCILYYAFYPCGHQSSKWIYCPKAKAKSFLKCGPQTACDTYTSIETAPDLEDTCGSTCLTQPYQCTRCGASKQVGWRCSRCNHLRSKDSPVWDPCNCPNPNHNCPHLALGKKGQAVCEHCRNGTCASVTGVKAQVRAKPTPVPAALMDVAIPDVADAKRCFHVSAGAGVLIPSLTVALGFVGSVLSLVRDFKSDMRLLNAKTWKLYDFLESHTPPYAILSHTWGAAEVTFADIQRTLPLYRRKKGWDKIKWCCRQALQDGIEYVWVDTCCIDKSSSAELQEAINSMFRWYENSQVCYAYLVDVRSDEKPDATGSSFRQSRWLKRGWTLQELIAPNSVIFFDASWNLVGTRDSLRDVISSVTGIHKAVLRNLLYGVPVYGALEVIRKVSTAQKMSWAAGRSTTRPEDMAYCLLGIFEINMPLLYGEGTKAFARLQEEIMKSSHDQTILAWGFMKPISTSSDVSHALATSPSDFSECSDLVSFGVAEPGDTFSMTQRGLQLNLPVVDVYRDGTTLYCLLNCGVKSLAENAELRILALPLFQGQSLYRYRPLYFPSADEYFRLTLTTPLWIPYSHIRGLPRRAIHLPKLWSYKQLDVRLGRVKMDVDLKDFEVPSKYFVAGVWPPALVYNDLLQYQSERSPGAGCVMVHIARPSKPGFILVMRYRYRNVGQMNEPIADYEWFSFSQHENDLINVVRSTVADILKLSVEDVDDRWKLVDLGIDSIASIEMINRIRKETELPVYSDSLLGCVSLRDVERNVVELSRAAPETGSYLEFECGVDLRVLTRRIKDPGFSLVEVDESASLLEYVKDSEICRKTWSDLRVVKPREIEKPPEGEEHYEVDLALDSHVGSQVTLKVCLKAVVASSELSLRLTPLVDEPAGS
ncbi:heterokaryon incompatibility protein-domain-containing protein [Annulohypoxylon bovei var. microspora]|nr:heterokaryon incompatibility protein-domain-containing protein [Annulohypoxylon bovei var. microspora]